MIEFKCLSDCGKCCGIVPLQKEVFQKHKDKFQRKIKEIVEMGDEIYPLTNDLNCIFLGSKKECLIYHDRPEVCKTYGLIEDLPCAYIKPNGRKRSPAKTRRMERIIEHKIEFDLKNLKRMVVVNKN